jgi:hypothetical protein
MAQSKKKSNPRTQLLMMAGIPVNRPYVYEKPFFKEGASVAQGIRFPLKKKRYKGGKEKLGGGAENFGVSRRGVDVRNISYADGDQ